MTVRIRTALLYIVIIAAVRFMGKRQISDLQTTELVVTMLISDIASMAAQNTSQPLLYGMIPMTVLVVSEVLLSGAMIKIAPLRRLICGRPIIVINDGKVEQKELRRLRMSVEDLSEELRAFHPAFDADVYDAMSLKACVERRALPGGPAPSAVTAAIAQAKQALEKPAI